MAEIVVKDILEAGVHYGHRSSRWNPKMRPYIYGRRNQIHIIDIKETIRGLIRARKYLLKVAAQGGLILFVGTKRQAAASIEELATECRMPFCTERWLGGTLTNFRTIRTRLKRLEELEKIRESDEIRNYSKKMQSSLRREFRKMERNLGGIKNLEKAPTIVFVGRITRQKGLPYFLRAVRELPDGIQVVLCAGAPVIVPAASCLASQIEHENEAYLDELYAAIVDGAKPVHDGAWAMGTIEVCLAMLRSARTGKDVKLRNQIALRPS